MIDCKILKTCWRFVAQRRVDSHWMSHSIVMATRLHNMIIPSWSPTIVIFPYPPKLFDNFLHGWSIFACRSSTLKSQSKYLLYYQIFQHFRHLRIQYLPLVAFFIFVEGLHRRQFIALVMLKTALQWLLSVICSWGFVNQSS